MPRPARAALIAILLAGGALVLPLAPAEATPAEVAPRGPTATTRVSFPEPGLEVTNVTLWLDAQDVDAWIWRFPPGHDIVSARDDTGGIGFAPEGDEPGAFRFFPRYAPGDGLQPLYLSAARAHPDARTLGVLRTTALAFAPDPHGGSARLVVEAPPNGTLLLADGREASRVDLNATSLIDLEYVVMFATSQGGYRSIHATPGLHALGPRAWNLSDSTGPAQKARAILSDVDPLLAVLERFAGPASDEEARLLVVFTTDARALDPALARESATLVLAAESIETADPNWRLERTRALIADAARLATARALAARGETAWFVEGSARYAERFAEEAYPERTYACARECRSFTSQLDYEALVALYRGPREALPDAAWAPRANDTPESLDRARAYWAWVVGAYVASHGEDAYRRALAGEVAGTCGECRPGTIEADLMRAVGLTRRDDLYLPSAGQLAANESAFRDFARPVLLPVAPEPGRPGAAVAPREQADAESGTGIDGLPLIPVTTGLAAFLATLAALLILSRLLPGDLARGHRRVSAWRPALARVCDEEGEPSALGPAVLFERADGVALLARRGLRAPREAAVASLAALLAAGPALALALLPAFAPAPAWTALLGAALALPALPLLHAARHPAAGWAFGREGARYLRSDALGRARERWDAPLPVLTGFGVAAHRATFAGAPSAGYLVTVATVEGEARVAFFSTREDALAFASRLARATGAPVREQIAGAR